MGEWSKKRLRREMARLKQLKKEGVLKDIPGQKPHAGAAQERAAHPAHHSHEHPKEHTLRYKKGSSFLEHIKEKYVIHYKKLLLITMVILLLAMMQIGWQAATTGDFIHKGISLKGGITVTIPKTDANAVELEKHLLSKFTANDLSVRNLAETSGQAGLIIEADITDKDSIDGFVSVIEEKTGKLSKDDYSVEFVGSSLGESFFKQTFKAMIMAFLFMSMVVFLFFGENTYAKMAVFTLAIADALVVYYSSSIISVLAAVALFGVLVYIFMKYSFPSVAVVLCAFSDIISTIAVVNLLGIKVSTAGIAAFLMLIGYSVDTDMLLSTRVLRRKEGTVFDATFGAMGTGFLMTLTTMTAVIVGLIFSKSDVLTQIMTILFIGLMFDLMFTWIQNAGLLEWYLQSKERKGKHGQD